MIVARGVIHIANVYKIYCSDRYNYNSAQIRGRWKICISQSKNREQSQKHHYEDLLSGKVKHTFEARTFLY